MPLQKEKSPVVVGTLVFLSKPTHAGWSFGEFQAENGLKFAVAGTALTGLKTHESYEIRGDWGIYRGETQLKVVSAIPHVKANLASLSRYLTSQYKGMGQKTVKDLIGRWEEQGRTLEELSQWAVYEPHQLEDWANTSSGLSRHLFYREPKNGLLPEEDLVQRALQSRYKANSANEVLVTDATIRRLTRHLLGLPLEGGIPKDVKPTKTAGQALEDFQTDPFAPMFKVENYGFKAADKIWTALKKPRLDPIRVGALGWDVLNTACESGGHTFLTANGFSKALAFFDDRLDLETVEAAMRERDSNVVVENGRYYTKALFWAEKEVAERMKTWTAPVAPLIQKSKGDLLNQIHTLEASRGMTLDKQQRDALVGIATSECRFHTVTAMPGCGKTAIMEFLAQLIRKDADAQKEQGKAGHTLAFMAPTGKASKVLNDRVKKLGLEAKTVHAAIGWGNPLGLSRISESVVVVDESSMVDLQLMAAFLSQVDPSAHVIFIGDTDQLASVGPGNVLGDTLKLPFDHHRLETVHRNTGDILKLVRSIKEGKYERVHGNDVMTYALPSPEKDMERVLSAYVSECQAQPQGAKRVGLLTGLRKGNADTPGWNVTYLNRALQGRMNPDGVPVSGSFLRLEDRVIVKKNQKYEFERTDKEGLKKTYEEYIANGDTGTLKDVQRDANGAVAKVVLDFDDGRSLGLPAEALETLAHAWAITIHQSQGSEYASVMLFAQNGHPTLFNRKLLYTGVSRAKEKLTLFGDRSALETLVSRKGDHRHSMLAERVLGLDSELNAVAANASDGVFQDGSVHQSQGEIQAERKPKRPRF